MKNFVVRKISQKSRARAGILTTAHGDIQTPAFMAIATQGAVKGLTVPEVKTLGADIILSNTYHQYLQPGVAVIKKFGGLHKFMNCDLPILTDSGGFQIFSLANIARVKRDGVEFRSHIDGSKHFLTPSKSIDIQMALGSDIMMVLDLFPGYPATRKKAKQSVETTTRWAEESLKRRKEKGERRKGAEQMLFAIVQGSTFKDLRLQSVKELTAMDFSAKGGPALGWDGYAVGGLAVGEPAKKMYQALDWVVPHLPADKPRYLMGVGYPENIVEAVKRGIDMFDCVIPTREARHGRLFIWSSKGRLTLKGDFYSTINIRNSAFRTDKKSVDKNCDCLLCKEYSRGYLHHLFKTNEMLGMRLATIHNLRFYLQLMSELRQAIKKQIL
ncbi:MAG: tRNA guanosine(34) transglycosylase Tgt [Candidatus Komeilibacteria bacterium]